MSASTFAQSTISLVAGGRPVTRSWFRATVRTIGWSVGTSTGSMTSRRRPLQLDLVLPLPEVVGEEPGDRRLVGAEARDANEVAGKVGDVVRADAGENALGGLAVRAGSLPR